MKYKSEFYIFILIIACFYSISSTSASALSDLTEIKLTENTKSSIPACIPQEKPTNNILPIFDIIKEELAELSQIVISADRTNNCLPSLVNTPKPDTSAITEDIKNLGALIIHFLGDKVSPISACSSENLFGCCVDLNNTHAECLISQNINPSSSPMMKLSAKLQSFTVIGRELSRTSFIIKKSDLKAHKFDGDELFFAWPHLYKNGEVEYILFTRLTPELVNNLSATINLLAPTLKVAFNKSITGSSGYECTSNGIFARQKPNLTKEASLSIGTGTDADILRPDGKNYPSSISISSGKSGETDSSYIEMKVSNAQPIGGDNKSLFEFAGKLKNFDLKPLECYGDGFSKIFSNESLLRNFNTLDASVFFFGFLYLNGAYREYLAPVTQMASISIGASEQVKASNKTIANTNQMDFSPQNNCQVLCDNKDPKCILIDIRDEIHYSAYRKLYEEIDKPIPFYITQDKLQEIFSWDESPDFRGPIIFSDEGVTNKGELAHTIKDINDLKRVIIDYPEDMASTYNKVASVINGNSYLFEFTDRCKAPFVSFYEPHSNKIDQIYDSRWGGDIRRIIVDIKRIIIETKNCIEIPLQESDIVTYNERMSLLANDLKFQEIGLLKSDIEIQEIGLLTSATCSGPQWGGKTPHVGCSNGKFKCSCDSYDACCFNNQSCSCDKDGYPTCH